tara:strand:+ start:527 stop:1117 length:591 start_codon:yes stop_codon:yes gene_type:complete
MIWFNPIFQHFLKFNIYEWIGYAFVKDMKLARNLSAGTHACGAVCLNALHMLYPTSSLFALCRHWSTGYFLYDIYFTLMYEKLNKIRLAYIYHHLATSYFITFPPKQYFSDEVLFWGELSNIPSYFVYHYLHTKSNPKELMKWKNIQKFVYTAIRIPILTGFMVKGLLRSPDKLPVLTMTPVYFMGLAWAMKLLKK